jgi:NAD(P)H dehydrogenase (quinone)
MSQIKLAVIYYSAYGTNYRMASTAAEAARDAGAEVKLLRVREIVAQEVIDRQPAWKANQEATANIPEASTSDLEWADAYLFSVPTRYGGAAAPIRAFFDTTGALWSSGKLANKCATVMTSSQQPHGGQETTLLTMYISLCHWGCILVPTGYTDQSVFGAGGNPYGTSATASGQPVAEEVLAAARHQARRLVDVAQRLKGA